MANKRYSENDDEPGGTASLPEKVKGKVGPGADFKPFTNPDGVTDGDAQDVNGGGVKMPQDSTSKLPKAGGKVE